MPISLETLRAAAARQPSIPKLAASPVQQLKSDPKLLNNPLFEKQMVTWVQDVKYLRDTYDEIFQTWDKNPWQTPEDEKSLYTTTEPKLEELIQGLADVSKQRSGRADLYKAVERAGQDAQVAALYAQGGDFAMASMYQSYALTKIHSMLESLTLEGKRPKASFLIKKKGYGYDVSGEIQEGVGNNADQKSEWDQGRPDEGHTTPKPKGNINFDTDAELDFPELAQKKHQKMHWPARTD